MLRIALLHSRLQVTIMAVLAGLFVWGLICVLRGRVGHGYLAGLWVAQLLITAQCLLGLILLFSGFNPLSLALHIIYGIIAVTSLPALIRYTRTLTGREAAWYLTAGCFVLLIVVGRAFETVG